MSYINAHVTPGTTEAKGNWAGNCPGFLAGAKYVGSQMARKQKADAQPARSLHEDQKEKPKGGEKLQPATIPVLIFCFLLIRVCVIS